MFLEIVFPKYQWTTAVDIEANYKSVPATSYSKYDQAYTSTTTGNCGQDAEEESPASEGETETVGKPTGKSPDMQNVWDITETVMEERVVEEIPPNTWEQVL